MKKLLEYRGYRGTVEYTDEDGVFFGEVTNIPGLISYEGENEEKLRENFEETIDFYLASCEEDGRTPMRPSSDGVGELSISA